MISDQEKSLACWKDTVGKFENSKIYCENGILVIYVDEDTHVVASPSTDLLSALKEEIEIIPFDISKPELKTIRNCFEYYEKLSIDKWISIEETDDLNNGKG